jgi:hypothetical protein
MPDIKETFGVISEDFKLFKENIPYTELPQQTITFNSKELELEQYTNLYDIMKEINEIARKLFLYGMIYESQSRVLQQIEDDFEMWLAKKFSNIDSLMPPLSKSEKRSDKARENFIKSYYEEEYRYYQTLIRNEEYKLGIIKRVVSGLENYGFKLHALKDYNISASKF